MAAATPRASSFGDIRDPGVIEYREKRKRLYPQVYPRYKTDSPYQPQTMADIGNVTSGIGRSYPSKYTRRILPPLPTGWKESKANVGVRKGGIFYTNSDERLKQWERPKFKPKQMDALTEHPADCSCPDCRRDQVESGLRNARQNAKKLSFAAPIQQAKERGIRQLKGEERRKRIAQARAARARAMAKRKPFLKNKSAARTVPSSRIRQVSSGGRRLLRASEAPWLFALILLFIFVLCFVLRRRFWKARPDMAHRPSQRRESLPAGEKLK